MNEEEKEEEDKKDSNTTMICLYCKGSVIGPPHIMKASRGVIEMSGALCIHWSTSCSYFDDYHMKLKLVAVQALNYSRLVQPQLRVILEANGDKVMQCFQLSTEFQKQKAELAEFLIEWKINHKETYPFPVVASGDINITDDMEFLRMFGKLASENYHHKGEGYMTWIGDELFDVTGAIQENNLMRMKMEEFRYRCLTCSRLFSCKAGWKEHSLLTYCKCDVFEDGKYKYTLTAHSGAKSKREFKDRELEEIEAEIAMTYMKEPNLQMLPKKAKSALEVNRHSQRKSAHALFKEHKEMLMTVEKWLLKLQQYQTPGFEMTRVGVPICDAIILPYCPLEFGVNQAEHNSNMKIFLIGHHIPVLYINPSQRKKDKCVLVQLTDSKN